MNINNSKYIFYAFNKKWKSIRECCKYYEVRYGSVMSYKRIHKCTAEEAIAYCRNLKKLGIFYFKKVRWTDLKVCCDYYNINYKSLCTYMQKNKISKEEALSIIISIINIIVLHITMWLMIVLQLVVRLTILNRFASEDMREKNIFYCGMHLPTIWIIIINEKCISADRNILHLHHVAEHLDAMHLMCRHTQNGTEYPEKKLWNFISIGVIKSGAQ